MSSEEQRSARPESLRKPRKGGLSIAQKLIALIFLTTGLIVGLLTSFWLRQQFQTSHTALERKAATYGRLVSKEVQSAIAFDDQATAREVFDSIAQDADIESLLLLTERGETLYAHGAPGSWTAAARGGVVAQRVVDLGDRIGVVAPVTSAEGPRGTLVIELSTRELDLAKRRQIQTALLMAGLSLVFGACLAFLIARSLHNRLERITRVAAAVTGGDLAQPPVALAGNDEITLLGQAFNAMLTHIQSLVQQIKESAEHEQARLENLVRARTHELHVCNEEMRLVLDNVDQGFVSVDLKAKLSPERSAIIERWLSEPSESDTLFSWIERSFPEKGDVFRVAWEALSEDWMPLEMRIDQLPRELRRGEQSFTFAYNPLFDEGNLDKILVVMTDTTAVVAKRRAEEEEHELAQIVRKLLEDRGGFSDFVAEADVLVETIAKTQHDRQSLRLLHTLKGNAAIFGFMSLSRACHELETTVAERGDAALSAAERELLRAHWTRLKGKVKELTATHRDAIEVSERDYAALLACVDTHAPPAQLRELLQTWKLEMVETRLARLGEYAHALAHRLGKAPIEVNVDAGGVRLDPHAWTPVWQALVHVVRNAVDHGLESPDDRMAVHKLGPAKLSLRAKLEGLLLTIEVTDQGRGIDWDLVAQAAEARGLPHLTSEQLTDMLWLDGLSTREKADDTSGRGVGLSAVKQVCLETGGRVSVRSERGLGTSFTFEWKVDSAHRPMGAPSLFPAASQLRAVGA